MSELSPRSRARVVLRGVAALALFALAAITTRQTVTGFWEREPNETCPERIARRYRPLRDHLPARGVVGYMGPELSDDGCNSKYLAQYVLAPVLVTHVWEVDHRAAARQTDFVVPVKPTLVVVDKREPLAKAWLRDSPDYSVVMDFGDGLLIAGRNQ